jgi:hypothetical protein
MSTILIHIGYHKTGTNWFQSRLFADARSGMRWLGKWKGHPVRRLVTARPLEFDAAAARASFEPLLSEIRRQNLLPVVSYERLSGHPFSGGLDSKEIADRLVQVFPEGRVLVVVREQRSAIISTYKQYVRAGGPLPLDLFLGPPRSQSMRMPSFDFRHFDYCHLLRYYRSLFGPDRVLALPFERFLRDGAGFVADIGAFAGRPFTAELLDSLRYDRRSNVAPTAAVIAVRRRLNRLVKRSELNVAPVFPSKRAARVADRWSRSSWLEHVAGWLPGSQTEAKLRQQVEELVGDRYIDSNHETAELLGVDLGAYGWMV